MWFATNWDIMCSIYNYNNTEASIYYIYWLTDSTEYWLTNTVYN